MLNTLFVVLLLSFVAYSDAYVHLPFTVTARSLQKLSASGNADYNALLENVKKATPPGSTVVIKYGGHAMENAEAKERFCEDIAALCRIGILPVIVHGGGPQIAKMLSSLGVESKFVNGLRVTDEKTMEVAQMVLCGSINKEIVGRISMKEGVKGAIGLSGLDAGLVRAKVKDPSLGLVGEPTSVNVIVIKELLAMKLVPVIAPIGCNEVGGTSLNINADTAAGAVSEALKAARLLLLTDVVGVLDKNKVMIDIIKSGSLRSLTADGTITGGMIPKLETAAQAVEAGVNTVSIMDGRVENCVLRALCGEPFGTRIIKG